MKVIELLNFNRELLKRLQAVGIRSVSGWKILNILTYTLIIFVY